MKHAAIGMLIGLGIFQAMFDLIAYDKIIHGEAAWRLLTGRREGFYSDNMPTAYAGPNGTVDCSVGLNGPHYPPRADGMCHYEDAP